MSPSSGATRSRTTVVTVAAVLLAVVALAVGLLVPSMASGGEDGERAAVLQRAEDFAVTYNTYDVADKQEYQERMRDLLTPDYYTEFARITDAVFAALDSKEQTSGDARVLSSAVDSFDDENAVALVAVDAAISTAQDEAAVQRRFRWKVSFAKQDGQWRVSQFESVVPLDAELGSAEEDGGVLPGTGDTPPDSAPQDGAPQDGAGQEEGQ